MHGSRNDVLWLQKDFGLYLGTSSFLLPVPPLPATEGTFAHLPPHRLRRPPVNVFDTFFACKLLNLERASLSFLQQKYCRDLLVDVVSSSKQQQQLKKQMQRCDWRTRPLTKQQLRYATEDTRYLL